MHWRVRVAALVCALALGATACGGTGEEGRSLSPGGVVEGGVLRIGDLGTIDSLNPFAYFSQQTVNTFQSIYPYLVQYDSDLGFTGDFATKWESSPDGLTWTFETVAGASWSDGQPLTAEDAAYTINTIIKYADGPTGSSAAYVAAMEGAEATGPNTLVIRYKEPVATVLSDLNHIPILPEHIWSQHEGNNGKDLKTFNNAPPIVSGGPFVLTQYQKRDFARFERNPNYYGPKPHIDGYGVKFFTNADAMVQALLNGEIDMIDSVPPNALETLRGNPGVRIVTAPGVTEDDFIFNSNPDKSQNLELLDPKLREAFAHAIDKQQIVDVVRGGNGAVGTTFIPPATGLWHNSDIQTEGYDPALANQMLDELGYLRGPDGIRVANGHPMEYDVLLPNDVEGIEREFQIIQANLEEVGVRLNARLEDSTAVWNEMTENDYKDWDLAIWYWVPLIDPDFMLAALTTDQWFGWSDTAYTNPEYDALYSKQKRTLDVEERRKIVWEMQQIVFDDKPYIMLDYRDVVEAWSPKWDGFWVSPQGTWNQLSKVTWHEVHQVAGTD
jgi:peptide/nickel transport system substrate-binding protein